MKKKYMTALAIGAAGVWCAYRDRKYPVRRELRFASKLAVPGWTLRPETARLSNWMLARREPPRPPSSRP